MAVMAVPFLFFPPTESKKKETTTSILFALISLLHWTLSLAWLWQLKAWSPQQDNSVQMVVFRLTLRKSVLFHRYIVVIAPLTRQPLISPAVHLQGRKYLSVIYKGTGRTQPVYLWLYLRRIILSRAKRKTAWYCRLSSNRVVVAVFQSTISSNSWNEYQVSSSSCDSK